MPSPLPLSHLPQFTERAIALQCLCEMSAPLIAYPINRETAQEEGEGERLAISHHKRRHEWIDISIHFYIFLYIFTFLYILYISIYFHTFRYISVYFYYLYIFHMSIHFCIFLYISYISIRFYIFPDVCFDILLYLNISINFSTFLEIFLNFYLNIFSTVDFNE